MVGQWEVERRFLASSEAPDSDPIHITQIYLDLCELDVDGGRLKHAVHGVIADFGDAGGEIEKVLSEDDFAVARLRKIGNQVICGIKSKMSEGKRREFEVLTPFNPDLLGKKIAIIEKSRCMWEGEDGLIWEIDRYAQPKLDFILAEVELDRIDQEVVLPEWIIQEVTYDLAYTNSELANLTLSAGGGI